MWIALSGLNKFLVCVVNIFLFYLHCVTFSLKHSNRILVTRNIRKILLWLYGLTLMLITVVTPLQLHACYHLAQSILKVLYYRKSGMGECGWVSPSVWQCIWWLLQLAVEMPWVAPGWLYFFSIILVNECSKCSFQVVVHGLHFWQCRKLLVHAEEHSLVGEPSLLNAHYWVRVVKLAKNI